MSGPAKSAFGPSQFAQNSNTDENSSKPAVNTTTADASALSAEQEDQKIAELRQQMAQMEQEAAKLKQIQETGQSNESQSSPIKPQSESASTEEPQHLDIEQRREIDNRSVFVGNVDFTATPEELQKFFNDCGTINRVTILTNKRTGNPKGFAYVEFVDPVSVPKALQMSDSLFKGRMLKVSVKRTNLPGFSRRGHRGRGRGRFRGRGRARGRGAFKPY